MHLGVHVIGNGVGESIVVQLPDGSAGVIDCYTSTVNAKTAADRISANATLRFLVNDLKVDSLAFLAVTHPHEDHARGVNQLLEHFGRRINELWMYSCWQETSLQTYFKALGNIGFKHPVEKLLKETAGTFRRELLLTRKHARDLMDASNCRFRMFQGFTRFQLCDGRIEVCFLGPSDSRSERYRTRLIDNLEGVVTEDATVVDDTWRPRSVNHNDISAGCRIKFGATVVIIGGDMESDAWEDVMRDPSIDLKAHYVKVAHHGSTNGYCDGLYEAHAIGKRRPIAVLTPKTTNHLPRKNGIRHIHALAGRLMSTNRAVIGTYTDRLDDRTVEKWVGLLARNPRWVSFAHSSLIEGEFGEGKEIPQALCELLVEQPSLIAGLREDLRDATVKPSEGAAESECRVSCLFDERGNELKSGSHVGALAGSLDDV